MSRMRPDAPIFAFCDSQETRQRLNLRWGVIPFRIDLQSDPEANVQRTFALLKKRELISTGDLVVVVSDVRQEGMAAPVSAEAVERGQGVVRSVQVRRVPWKSDVDLHLLFSRCDDDNVVLVWESFIEMMRLEGKREKSGFERKCLWEEQSEIWLLVLFAKELL